MWSFLVDIAKGICTPNSTNPALYVPWNRSVLPDHGMPHCYGPLALPMCTHDDVIQKACTIEAALNQNQTQQKSLATQSDINGLSSLTQLSSIHIPTSFPYNFMHLIWENLIPNLVSLWTGTYHGLTGGDFKILIERWKAIGVAMYECSMLIPSQFGARVPNIHDKCSKFTAENWLFWTLFIAPIFLHNAFTHPIYYMHFIKLVKLLNICLVFELHHEDLEVFAS